MKGGMGRAQPVLVAVSLGLRCFLVGLVGVEEGLSGWGVVVSAFFCRRVVLGSAGVPPGCGSEFGRKRVSGSLLGGFSKSSWRDARVSASPDLYSE